jgi:hypothetical protein
MVEDQVADRPKISAASTALESAVLPHWSFSLG